MVLRLFIAAMLTIWVSTPAFAAAAAQNVQISTQVGMGLQAVYPQTIYTYQEPSTTTAQYQASTVLTITHNTVNNAVSIASLFPAFATPICIGICEITSPGLNLSVGLSSGGPRVSLAAGGFMIFRTATGLPTFYIDNADLTEDAQIRVFGLSN